MSAEVEAVHAVWAKQHPFVLGPPTGVHVTFWPPSGDRPPTAKVHQGLGGAQHTHEPEVLREAARRLMEAADLLDALLDVWAGVLPSVCPACDTSQIGSEPRFRGNVP